MCRNPRGREVQEEDKKVRNYLVPGLVASPQLTLADLKKVFAFDNMLLNDLSKVGWTISRLPRSVLQTLAVEGPKLKSASDKVIGYLDAHCGMHLPKP